MQKIVMGNYVITEVILKIAFENFVVREVVSAITGIQIRFRI